MATQSVLFSRYLWTEDEARDWLVSKGYVNGKVHVTHDYLRFRQHTPRAGARYYTFELPGTGILLVNEAD